jgi:hypothetical protein
MPASGKDPECWSATDKFTVVLETAGLNDTELTAYCRERGLFPEQMDRWRQVVLRSALGLIAPRGGCCQREISAQRIRRPQIKRRKLDFRLAYISYQVSEMNVKLRR